MAGPPLIWQTPALAQAYVVAVVFFTSEPLNIMSSSAPSKSEFVRINRLPPYVFAIINELKQAARARGEDIIDFGMGNPDRPTPSAHRRQADQAAQRPDTHRYSVSRGVLRLRQAISRLVQASFRRGHRSRDRSDRHHGFQRGTGPSHARNSRTWRPGTGPRTRPIRFIRTGRLSPARKCATCA